jgi:peptide/nickel transport system substrate-binding protein
MNKFSFLIIALVTFLFNGCKSEVDPTVITLINGGRTYGGEVKFMSPERIQGLFPPTATDKYSYSVLSQIFEQLLKIDPATLEVEACVAESYKVNTEGNIFEFAIRKGIFFHDDDCFGGSGRELTPADVKYSLDYACSNQPFNNVGNILVNNIQGADDYFKKSKNTLPKGGVSGIKVLDGNKVQITLNKPFVGFEKVLGQQNIVIFAKEAVETYKEKVSEHPIGTGPFVLHSKDADGIRLVRNNNYWKKDAFGNKLPYLAAIQISYMKDKKSEMLAFRNEDLDLLLEIPVEEIDNVLGTLEEAKEGKNLKHKLESSNSLSVEYIGFNHKSPVFRNVLVRRAFMFAINPTEVIDKKLLGEGNALTNGFVPEMEGMRSEIIPVLADPEKARSLLAQAGYPDGKGFPEIDILVNAIQGSKIDVLITGLVNQINNELNIKLTIKRCSYFEREKAIANGTAQIWRAGWIADYPDPQNFLGNFYGNGMKENVFNFSNEKYNTNYEAALIEKNKSLRDNLLTKCGQQVVDEAFVLPTYNNNVLFLVNARVKGIVASPMEVIDFTEVYIKEQRKEGEYKSY